jgi:hypothetical protein
MNKSVTVKNHLMHGLVMIACIILSTGFRYGGNGKTTNPEVTITILQENDGFTIAVKTNKNINVHFYLFTVDGRLVKELNIYGSKRISVTPLEKGIYIYDFFSNDERLKNGKIELR